MQTNVYPLIATLKPKYIYSQLRWLYIYTLLKPQSNGPSYSNTVISTLAVDGWAVTFGTALSGLGGDAARSGPCSLYQM